MKKSFVLLVIMSMALAATAQIKFGIKGGLSTTELEPNQLIITDRNDIEQLGLTVENANYGVHLGLFTQIKIGKFFLQPEVLFNSNTVEYGIQDFADAGLIESLRSESYQHLDIPVLMGFKFGPLRLGGGPVGHVFINSSSELFDLDGYGQKFDEMTWGWQAGVGLDLWKLMFDIRYEGNFNKFGEHITFHDQQFNFDQTPGRFVASVGISF